MEQNKNARILEKGDAGTNFDVETVYREPWTLSARASVRERNDVDTGRSLTGLSIKTASGRYVRFSGQEARTLYRVLERAING